MTAIADDYRDSPLTTGKLVVGTSTNATFSPVADTDWFAVSLVAGTEYMFRLTLASGLQRFQYFWLDLLDADGNYLNIGVPGSTTVNPAINFRPGVSGTYYLAAGFENDADAAATVNYAVSAAVRGGADDHPVGVAGAGVLSATGTATGVFEVSGDRDWYKFHADAGIHYAFGTITSAAAGAPAGAVPASFLHIVDANGAVLPSSIGATFDALVTGDYYLDVSGLRPGNYSILSSARADDHPATDAGAGVLALGGSVKGVMDYNNDTDRFSVTLEAGNYYTFTLASSYLDQSGMGLYGPDGAALEWANYGYTATGPTRALDVRIGTTGVYHLDVTQSAIYTANGATGAYTLGASVGRADDIGDTIASAAPLAVGAVVHAAIQGNVDLDMFKVTLQAGTTYAFALNPDVAGVNTVSLGLRDASGAVVNAGTYGNLANGTYTPTRTGDYFAVVSTGAVLTASQPYTLSVTTPQDDFGASAASAGRLAIGATIAGKIEAGGGDHDWFAVNLAAGTTYWFTVTDTVAGTYASVRLLGADGSALASTGASSARATGITLPYLASQTGTFYLDIAGGASSAGAYTIAAAIGQRDDYGNTPTSAGVVTPSVPASARFELATDTDMFKISLVAGVTYSLDAPAVSGSGVDGGANLVLSNAAGAALASSALPGGGNAILFTAAATGDAYVTASTSSGAFAYTLNETVYGVDDFLAGSATKGVLAIGARVQGALSYPGDVDTLRVHLEAGVAYAFQLLGAASGGGTLAASYGVGFTLRDATGAALGGALAGSVDLRWTATPASGGDYYLSVDSPYALARGSYTVAALQLSVDAVGPTVVAQSRAAGTTGVGLGDKAFSMVFSEAVTVDKSAITIKNSAGVAVTLQDGSLLVNNQTLSFQALANFAPGSYTVSIPHAAVHDLAGNAYSGPELIPFTTVLPVAAGTPGNDLFMGDVDFTQVGHPSISVDGGAGTDTVLYSYPSYFYRISRAGDTLTINGSFNRSDTLAHVERLIFSDAARAYDVDGTGGQVYRLYQASFHRTPDQGGVGFWIAQMDQGASLREVARSFVGSAEFTTLYGDTPSDTAFLTALYSNVLHRSPDATGLDFWNTAMHNGGTRAEVLQQFSESAENQAALVAVISNGFAYTLY